MVRNKPDNDAAAHPGANWDRFIAWDPGFKRLTTALRTTATTCIAVGLLLFAVRVFHVSLTEGLLGVLVAMLSASAVSDPAPRAQRNTMLWAPVPAALMAVFGALTASNRVLADIAFVMVLFAAVYIRRYGPRFVAFGMLAVTPYFLAIFIKTTLAEVPGSVLAAIAGAALAFLMRFIILPEHPERALARMQSSFQARQRTIVRAVLRVIATTGGQDAAMHLRRQVVRLNEAALAIDEQLSQSGHYHPEHRLRELIFDAELATDNFVSAALRFYATRAVAPPELQHSLEAYCRGAAGEARDLAVASKPLNGKPAAESRWLRAAVEDLAAATLALMAPGHTNDLPVPQIQPAPAEASAVPRGLLPTTRQAIQVSAAATVAIVGGELISPARWYWAVLAAFAVFSGTTSSSDTIAKAWQRAAGTALGVAGGIAIGSFVGNSVAVDAPAIVLCLFLAMYFSALSYVTMAFFMTMMLSLLYSLLGTFSSALLLTRLELTLIGASCGVLATTLLFRSRARDAMRSSVKQMLTAVSDMVEQSMDNEADDPARRDSARAVDLAFAALRKQSRSRLTATYFTGTGMKLRQQLRLLNACAYYARNLAHTSGRWSGTSRGGNVEQHRVAETVRRNIASLIALIDDRHSSAPIDPATSIALGEAPEGKTERPEGHVRDTRLRLLQHLDAIVDKLASEITHTE